MRTIEVDARRYAWCRGHALWILGMPTATFVEDLHGALEDGQEGLLRYAARAIGEACAVVLGLVLLYDRPIPPPAMRGSWALERLAGHELADDCWALIRGGDEDPPSAVVQRCDRLVERVRQLVGEIPDVLSSEGYFPALALARDWLKLLDAVGEEGFLPRDWTRGR
jgi:hypothetical protein